MNRYVLILTLSFSFFNVKAQDWKLAKEKNDIKVYTKKTENSSFKTFKAITEINKSIPEIEKVLLDFKNYPNWVYNIEKSDIIEKVDKYNTFVHLHMGAPWPVSDRDLILKYSYTKQGVSTLITMDSHSSKIKKEDGIVRIIDAKGKWQLDKIDENNTRVTYQFLADPNGNLPSVVVNVFIVDGPIETLENLKNQF